MKLALLQVVSYDASTHIWKLSGGTILNIEGRWVSPIPITGVGGGSFPVPEINSFVFCAISDKKDVAYILGFPEMRGVSMMPDMVEDNPIPGTVVNKYADGSYTLKNMSGDSEDNNGPWAKEIKQGGLQYKKEFWKNKQVMHADGEEKWEINQINGVDKAGRTKYIKYISDGEEAAYNRDAEYLEETEPVAENYNYRNKIIFKAGSLVEQETDEGGVGVGEDAGATYITVSKQADILNNLPDTFIKTVWGRVKTGVKQLFKFKAWDKNEKSILEVSVNEQGAGSVHGVKVSHSQDAGKVEIDISSSDGKAVVVDVGEGKAGITIDYDGNITLGSASGVIKLGGTGQEQELVTKAFIDNFYAKHVHICGSPGAPTPPPVVPVVTTYIDNKNNPLTVTLKGE